MNQIIQKAEEAIRAKSSPRKLDQVVEAGEGIMFSDGGAKMFKDQIDKEGDLIENAAEGVAKLIGILFEQSKHTMPMDTAVTAASILMLRGLDFLEEAGRIEITPEVVAQAMKAMASYVLQLFGITPQMVQEMGGKQGKQGPQPEQPSPAEPGLIGGAMQGGA